MDGYIETDLNDGIIILPNGESITIDELPPGSEFYLILTRINGELTESKVLYPFASQLTE